jgi:hypothetical protein
MAHTRGPWHAYPADYHRLNDTDPLPIFVVGPNEFHTVAQVRAGNIDGDLLAQTPANAALIAAAPELLTALRTAPGRMRVTSLSRR